MNQNSTPPPDLNQPASQEIVQLSPRDKQDTKGEKFTRARIFLFISLPILILIFNTNTIIISIITTMLILLGIGNIFDPISNGILKYCEGTLIFLGKPFEWLWQFFFVKHRTSLGHQLKRRRRLIIDTVTLISIALLLGTTTLHPFVAATSGYLNDSVCLSTHLHWIACDSGFGVTLLPDGVRIGLIVDNTFGPFDQSTLNQDETKVERLIFRENQQACTGRHVTLVVVSMLSRTVQDPQSSATSGLDDVQGFYLAQHDYNATHPAISICLAIANLGTADTGTKESALVKSHPDDYSLFQVIHQIAQMAHTDPSLRGIVGFITSQQVEEALNLIKGYQDLSTIPIVSPSASSDELSNVANFYRIASPDHSQGTALAQFFCASLIQSQPSDSIAMLTDSANAYSRSLELAFNDAIKCGDSTHRTTIPYTNGDPTSIREGVDQALKQHARYLLFPGYDQDMDTVELEIHQVLQNHANDITIIGGDGLNNVDATTHYSYNHVYATTSTGPLPQTNSIANDFVQQGFAKPPFENAIPSQLWIPTGALQSYDAFNAFAQTVKNWQYGSTQDDFNGVLASTSFNGVSGEITFQGNRNNKHSSDRDQGYIYISCNDYEHNIHLITKYSAINAGNSPVQNLPLSQTDGVSVCS